MEARHWLAIFGLVINYTMTASSILLLRCFYDAGFVWNRKKSFLLLIISTINLIGNLLSIPYIDNILFAAYVIISIYDYQGKKLVGFIRYAPVYLLIILIFVAIFSCVAAYIIPGFDPDLIETDEGTMLTMAIIMSVYFVSMFLVLYFKVHKKGIVIKCGKRESLFLCGYLLILTIVVGCIQGEGIHSNVAMSVVGYFIAIMAVTPPIFVFSICIGNHYHHRTKMQEVYLQSEVEHFRQYMHAQEETRRFRHDIRNNLLCMNEMVASGDHEKLAQYIKDMVEITDSLSFKYVTGDMLLDSILNSKAQYMEQQGIRFELDGVLAGGLPWKPMDICAVFANAIDNAIEACQKVTPEDRCISMRIKSTPQFWLITIENSVAEIVDTKKLFQKNGGYTSKSDSSRHGIGTYSMKQTVESYGAIMKAECTEQAFTLEIMIDKSK